MVKVVQLSDVVDPSIVRRFLKEDISFSYIPCEGEEEIIQASKDADVVIPIYERMTKKVMDACPRLKYICVASIGYDRVDLDYARKRGIRVSNNPFYCIEDVADHSLALALNLLRNVTEFHREVSEKGRWDYNAFGNTMHRVNTHVVGILGFGKIGCLVAKRFSAFGCHILGLDPYVSREEMEKYGAEKADLATFQKEVTVLSIHLPLTEETRGMVDGEFLTGFQKKPYVINTGRGGTVNQKDLLRAFEEDRLRGLALDVLEDENPETFDVSFGKNPHVLLTPHAAFYSQESVFQCDSNVAKYINAFVEGRFEDIPFVDEKR